MDIVDIVDIADIVDIVDIVDMLYMLDEGTDVGSSWVLHWERSSVVGSSPWWTHRPALDRDLHTFCRFQHHLALLCCTY